MREALVKKTGIINEINSKVEKAQTVVVVEYGKLKVSELQKLRKLLSENDSEMKVYKNNLVNFALKESQYKDLGKHLTGQNAFIFGYKDQLAPAKVPAKFAKEYKSLILKAGIYNNAVVDKTEINTIASLPSRDELYAMIAMMLKQPIVKLALSVKEIANQTQA